MACKTRLYLQAIIQLHQAIEQTIDGPNVVLGAGKRWVKGRDGVVLVVTESDAGFMAWAGLLTSGKPEKAEKGTEIFHAVKIGEFKQ